MDTQIIEETTKSTRFSTSRSTSSTTIPNIPVSTTKTFTTTGHITNEIPTQQDENPIIEDQTSENPISLTEDQTSKNPNSLTEDETSNSMIEDETTEMPISITEDQTSGILSSSIETTNAFSTPKLITLLTTNSRAIFKATLRTTASTKFDRTTKIHPDTTEEPRYIFVKDLIFKINFNDF